MRTRIARHILIVVVALALCLAAGVATRLPILDAATRSALAGRLSFEISDANGDPSDGRTVRRVQPALENIRAWISAVGASVGLADLDGDGLPNERCLVDPRDDSVTVGPTPERPGRFPAFALTPSGVPYDTGTTAPMGCVIADLNEDGYIDVLVYFWGRPPLLYLRRPGSPLTAAGFVATDVTPDPREIWNSTTANTVDLDGDGHLDLFIGNYFPDGARVLDATATEDPLMRMQDSMSNAANAGRNRILRFTGATRADGVMRPHFADSSSALTDTQSRRWTLATGAQDLDGDGLPELYVANDFGPDYLLHNLSQPGEIRFAELRGRRGLSEPKSKVLGNDSFKSMGVAFSDLNHDGRPDILVSNITTPYALQESNFAFVSTDTGPLEDGVAPYRDESQSLGMARTGWAWDIKAADFDGDGQDELVQALGFVQGGPSRWPELQELAMANDDVLRFPWAWPNFQPGDDIAGHQRDVFLTRDANGRFVDIAAEIGLDNRTPSRGIAIGDVDHDGRLDALIANQWDRSVFMRNTGGPRAYLGLRLRLPATGPGTLPRPAVGAAVTVKKPDGTRLSQQLFPANGHTSVNAPELVFGLGDTDPGPCEVTVTWRDAAGLHKTTTTLATGWHTLTLTAGSTS